MAFWDKFSDDELRSILNECHSLDEITLAFTQVSGDDWLEYSRKFNKRKVDFNHISQSLFATINDAPSYSIMTLLSIINIIIFKFFALSLLTAGFALITMIAATVYFAASYRDNYDEARKAERRFDFATIKIKCAEELIARQKKRVQYDTELKPHFHRVELLAHRHANYVYEDKGMLEKAKPALGACLLSANMLWTYYLGIGTIIGAFGAAAASAAMLGPIGIAIAIGVSVLIGIYAGYKAYQTSVNLEDTDKSLKHMSDEFEHKRQLYYILRDMEHEHSHKHRPLRRQTLSEPNLRHTKEFTPSGVRAQDFLTRRQTLYRYKRMPKEPFKSLTPDPSSIVPKPGFF